MKILAPLGSLDEIDKIIEAGADEVYCGVIDGEVNVKYKIPIINRRPYRVSNLKSYDELKEVVNISHASGKNVYVTMNEAFCSDVQYEFVAECLENMCKAKADAVIISDIGLLQFIKDQGYDIQIHMSTCSSIYNYEAVNFYKDMGATRIILPRHMTIDEINELKMRNPELEYEILVLNSNCHYDDGYCTYDHSLGNYVRNVNFVGGGCGAIRNIKNYYKKGSFANSKAPDIAAKYRERQSSLSSACGACFLGKMNLSEIDSLKIIGREFTISKKEKDIKFLSKVRDIIDTSPNPHDIKSDVMRIYKEIYNGDCMERCYY